MVTYLLQRFGDGVYGFARHWYADGFREAANITLGLLSSLDRIFAVKINISLLFTPLYQDRSFIGYVLGFLFRFFRVILGGAVYFAIAIAAAGVYAVWAAVPAFLLYKIVVNAR